MLDPTMTGIRDMIQKNYYWLNIVLEDSRRFPEQIDWSRTLLSDYESITRQDVSELSKKYLINNQAAVITIMPKQNNE